MRPLLIGFFVCINIHLGYAQWTEQDSIWLKDVLAGKDSIKLNPEFQKAIQSGSFLNPEPGKPMGKPQLAAPSQYPYHQRFLRIYPTRRYDTPKSSIEGFTAIGILAT